MNIAVRPTLFAQLAGYDGKSARADALAGLTTAIMLIPQAMAYAMLAGLPPIVGLYSSLLPLAAYAIFGSSRQLAVGPVAMVSLMVASGVGAIAPTGSADFIVLAAVLALMVGVFQLTMGVLRLGFLVDYLAHPVIAGFSSAAALIIGFSQLKHALGVDIPRSHHIHTILLGAFERASDIDLVTFAIAGGALATLIVLKRVAPRFPRFLLVVVAGTGAVYGLGLETAVVGDVPAGLPPLAWPSFGADTLRELLPTAVAISLVGFMESISVAKAFAKKNGYDVDADQELVGLGAANLVGGVFSGYPVTGGFSRTAVNAQAGAKTGIASVITALFVGLTLLWLTPLFYYLPKAVLAAIIMSAVFGLVDIAEARHLWRISRPDLALMGITFVATLTLGIELGILVGVAASLAGFLRKMSRPHVAMLGRLPGTTLYRKIDRNPGAEIEPGVLAFRFDAPLFFANASYLEKTLADLESQVSAPIEKVVFDATGVSGLDASAIAALDKVLERYEQRGVEVWIATMRGPIRDIMDRAGLVRRIGPERFVQRVHDAIHTEAKAA